MNFSHFFQSLETDIDDGDFLDTLSDTLHVFNAFSERFVRVVDSAYLPVNLAIKRSVGFMGGMRVKPIFRSLVGALGQFIKLLSSKIEEVIYMS